MDDNASFDDLVKKLVQLFGDQVKNYELGYLDDETEFIRVTGNEEWLVCVEDHAYRNKGKNVNTVYLKITDVAGIITLENSQCLSSAHNSVSPRSEEEFKLVQNVADSLLTLREKAPKIEPVEANSLPSLVQYSHIPVFENKSSEDMVFNLDIKGTPGELVAIQKEIMHKFAPMAGFEIDSAILKQDHVEKQLVEKKKEKSPASSTFSNQQKDEIEALIEAKLAKMNIQKKPEFVSSGNYDHGHVTCDGCNQRITGCARFKSLVIRDFDLCETCEAKGTHRGPMIKIREPIGFQLGMKINAQFDSLKKLFDKEEPKVVVAEKTPEPTTAPASRNLCHIRPAPVFVGKEMIEIIERIKLIFPNAPISEIQTFVKTQKDRPFDEILNVFIDRYFP